MFYRSTFNFIIISATLSFANSAFANPGYMQLFKAHYPKATGLVSCKLCHDGAPPKLNPYGMDFQKSTFNFVTIEGLDSDGDGFKNVDEITAGTFPGDKNSHPNAALAQ